jgi:hypothetical protein
MIDRYFSKADWFKTLENLLSHFLELIILVLAMVSHLTHPYLYRYLFALYPVHSLTIVKRLIIFSLT